MSRKKIDPETVDFTDREQLLAYVRQLPTTQQDVLWTVASQLKESGAEAMSYLYGAVDQIGDERLFVRRGLPQADAEQRACELARAIGRDGSPDGGRIE